MDKEKLQKVKVIYEQLLGLFHGLGTPTAKDGHRSGGPLIQFRHSVEELSRITGEDLNHFLPETTDNTEGAWYAPVDLKAQVSSLLSWVRASYLPDTDAPHYIQPSAATTSISQTVNQEVSVMQVVTLDIAELLTSKQADFEEGTPERTFIERVKSGLRGVKDTAALLALIMQTAQQCGLSADQLRSIFT